MFLFGDPLKTQIEWKKYNSHFFKDGGHKLITNVTMCLTQKVIFHI